MVILKLKSHGACTLWGIILLSSLSFAQSAMTPKLKEFLSRNDFLELIEKYGQDRVSLTIKGVEQREFEQRAYDIAGGYRCQVFAGAELSNANKVAAEMRALQPDSVYVVESGGNMYKVQIGNFQDRKDAQVMLDKLYYAGVRGAWIVETDIHIPRERRPDDDTKETQLESGFYYAVQVFNTKYPDRAEHFKETLTRRFSEPVEIIRQNDFWKIVVGRFNDQESASSLLEKLRREGFSDAWVTQIAN